MDNINTVNVIELNDNVVQNLHLNKPRPEREQLELVRREISYCVFQKGSLIATFYSYDSAVIALRRAGFVKNIKEKTFDVWMVPDESDMM